MNRSNEISRQFNSYAKAAGIKTDSRLQATQWLFEASNRLNNVIHELEAYVHVFELEDSYARMRIEETKNQEMYHSYDCKGNNSIE